MAVIATEPVYRMKAGILLNPSLANNRRYAIWIYQTLILLRTTFDVLVFPALGPLIQSEFDDFIIRNHLIPREAL